MGINFCLCFKVGIWFHFFLSEYPVVLSSFTRKPLLSLLISVSATCLQQVFTYGRICFWAHTTILLLVLVAGRADHYLIFSDVILFSDFFLRICFEYLNILCLIRSSLLFLMKIVFFLLLISWIVMVFSRRTCISFGVFISENLNFCYIFSLFWCLDMQLTFT